MKGISWRKGYWKFCGALLASLLWAGCDDSKGNEEGSGTELTPDSGALGGDGGGDSFDGSIPRDSGGAVADAGTPVDGGDTAGDEAVGDDDQDVSPGGGDGTEGEDPVVVYSYWEQSFAVSMEDPEGDDLGDGDYTYPVGVEAGSCDLRSFDLAYDAAEGLLDVEVGVTTISPNTRLSLVLWDEAAMNQYALEGGLGWVTGGTEIRVPYWNGHGVIFLFSLPEEESPLFDYTMSEGASNVARPDNAIYVNENPDAWLGLSGERTEWPELTQRLEVTSDTSGSPHALRFSVPVASLAPFIDTASPRLYAALYCYFVVEGEFAEYGAYEVRESEGGRNGWADCDAYDLAFLDEGEDQSQVLTAEPSDEKSSVVKLTQVGRGVLQIETQDEGEVDLDGGPTSEPDAGPTSEPDGGSVVVLSGDGGMSAP